MWVFQKTIKQMNEWDNNMKTERCPKGKYWEDHLNHIYRLPGLLRYSFEKQSFATITYLASGRPLSSVIIQGK